MSPQDPADDPDAAGTPATPETAKPEVAAASDADAPVAPRRPAGKPSLRSRLRPVELVGISAIIAVFVGLIVGMGTREVNVSLEFAGVAFVVALVVTAMLLLAATPQDERPDADREPPRGKGH